MDAAEDDAGRLHVADQSENRTDCIFYYRSLDGGQTFDMVRGTHGGGIWFDGQGDCGRGSGNVDKPWITTWGPNVVYLVYGEGGNSGVDCSVDGGKSFTHVTTAFPIEHARGIAVDPIDGTLYLFYQVIREFVPALGRNVAHRLGAAVSSDRCQTFSASTVVDRGSKDVWAGGFASGAVDRSGNVYVTWGDDSSGRVAIYFSVSRDRGRTWSAPRQVSSSQTVSIYPTIAAGDAGRIAIAWYGTPDPAVDRGNAPNTNWFVYLAISTNALNDNPTFEEVKVHPEPFHHNSICAHLDRCEGSPFPPQPPGYEGGIADFFRIALDPDGWLNVIWTDTAHHGDPPKDHFARQLSGTRLLQQGPTVLTLTVIREGSGSGMVTSNPAGINCGADCSEDYPSGTTVTLTATAASGSVFSGWSGGGCSGTGTCTVTMDSAKSVTATFTAPQTSILTVTMAGSGSGTVTSNPPGISCTTGVCMATFNRGTSVTLTAAAASGSAFTGWSDGGCSGTGTCTVTLDANKSVTATFSPAFTLTVNKTGTGTGTVTSSPAGINCGSTCSTTFNRGTAVTLTATAASGSVFARWSGNCEGTGACMVTMDGDRSVTATFTPLFTLTVNKTGTGAGTVTSSPAGINCGATCSASFTSGTTVTLTATAASGSVFSAWSGGGCSGTDTCSVTLTANTTVTATFDPAPAGGGGGGGCFIATAAFGSPLAAEVELLREFRDKELLTHAPGRLLVAAYYQVSPPLARLITSNEVLRSASRVTLRPVIWWAALALESPVLAWSLLILGAGGLVLVVITPFTLFRARHPPAKSERHYFL